MAGGGDEGFGGRRGGHAGGWGAGFGVRGGGVVHWGWGGGFMGGDGRWGVRLWRLEEGDVEWGVVCDSLDIEPFTKIPGAFISVLHVDIGAQCLSKHDPHSTSPPLSTVGARWVYCGESPLYSPMHYPYRSSRIPILHQTPPCHAFSPAS